jgi:hypothetical protein
MQRQCRTVSLCVINYNVYRLALVTLLKVREKMELNEQPNDQPTTKTDMTRGQQTMWIVGVLLAIAFVSLGLYLGQDNPRYPGCTGFMGIVDQECEARIAAQRIASTPYIPSY